MAINSQIVLRVNGREVQDTFNSLQRATRTLRREINQLEPGTEEFIERTQQLRQVEERFARVRSEIQGTTQDIRESRTELRNFSDIGPYLADRLGGGISTTSLSFRGLGTTIKTFAVEAWAAIGSIPIIGWIAAIAAGIGLMVKEVFDFNKEFGEANKLTRAYTKLKGEALDTMTVRSQSLQKAFGFDPEQTLEAAKNAVNSFKITYTQAMDEIELGAVKGGNANKEYLESLIEYAPFMAKAGFSFKEFVGIVNKGFDVGVFKDKLPDAIKEFDLSMREQTKSTRDALVNAFGVSFSDDLLKRVSTGKTTVKDSLIEINKEAEKYNLSQKQQAQLTADIFRGAGEDVGGFQVIMDAVTLSILEQNNNLTEEQQILKNQVDNYNELGEAKVDALKSDDVVAFQRDIENAWVNIQILWYKFVKGLGESINGLKLGFMNVRDFILILPKTLSSVFSAMKIDLGYMGTIVKSFGTVLKNAFTMNWDALDSSIDTFKSQLKNSLSTTQLALKNAKNDFSEINTKNYNAIIKENKAKADAQKLIDRIEQNKKKTNNFDGTAVNDPNKAAKDAAARAKKLAAENEKIRQQIQKDLEQSEKDLDASEKTKLDLKNKYRAEEIEQMKEGVAKQLAQADFAREQEVQKLTSDGNAIIAKILELEKKKLEAKSPAAKANYDKALQSELEAQKQHNLLVEKSEQTHQFKLKTIQEKANAKKIEDDSKKFAREIEITRRNREEEIIEITSLEDAKEQLRNNQFLKLSEKELAGIQSLEDAKNALREVANREMLRQQEKAIQLQLAQLQEALNDPSISEEARQQLAENLDFLKDKVVQLKAAIKGGEDADAKKVAGEKKEAKAKVDILGFSAQEWEDTFAKTDTLSEKLAAMGMIFKALGEAATMFGDLQRALGERELRNYTRIQNAKKSQLDKNLASGLITQEEYNKRTEAMDIDLANKQAEIEYKQAKADKISKIFGAIGATALGVANALSTGPAGILLAAIIGGLGAIQVATIAAQPLPEKPSFAGGGFTGAGYGKPDHTGFKVAGDVHEGEYVVPKWMNQHPRISPKIKELEFMRKAGPSSFADGGFVEGSSSASSAQNASVNPQDSNNLTVLVVRLLNLFQKIDDNGGLEAYIVDSPQNQKKMNTMVKKRQQLENKNKH